MISSGTKLKGKIKKYLKSANGRKKPANKTGNLAKKLGMKAGC